MSVHAYSDINDEFWTAELSVNENIVSDSDGLDGIIDGNTITGTWSDSGDGQSGNWSTRRSY